jgi:hypothetical protein
MDDLFDPNAFTWDYPLWVAFDIAKMADEANHPFGAFTQGEGDYTDGRHRFLGVFTDEDLARRFVEDFCLPPHSFTPIDHEQFGGLLNDAIRRGVRYVAFDVHSRGGKHFRIDKIAARL